MQRKTDVILKINELKMKVDSKSLFTKQRILQSVRKK